MIKRGELERYLSFAALKLDGQGGIVILIDCDWDDCCPARDGPRLKKRAERSRPDVRTAVILAKKEFEAWFVAAASSLVGRTGLRSGIEVVDDPESIRDAKGWLNSRMASGYGYSATENQPAFAEIFNMAAARCSSSSFDKCYREIRSLLEMLRQGS